MNKEELDLDINPARVLSGLSRIGYTPSSAICDIIDNSIRAKSENIHILIGREIESDDKRKNNVREYVIIDDGEGMDEYSIKNSLALGSSDIGYESNSLSKFGLGLKSASFSQGEELQVISSKDGNFIKYIVSLDEIKVNNKYFARKEDLNDKDKEFIKKYIKKKHGTIIRINKVKKINHPSIRKTVEELNYKIGVIYYYFMLDKTSISIEENKVLPFDVLFTNEATQNGNLDEHNWDATSVRWIEKNKETILDSENNVKCQIEVTQLPHPPIFDTIERGGRLKVRQKYRIEAGNYGYYVYRNKRLISWAEGFDGIIPQDQNYYSFRGRILINESADECFNIDVKKSNIVLSDEASNTLNDISMMYKRKSKIAWDRGEMLKSEKEGQDPNLKANEIVEDFETPEIISDTNANTQASLLETKKREKELVEEMKNKMKKMAVTNIKELENKTTTEEKLSEEDLEKALKEDSNPASKKIFRVKNVQDNALWEPYYDTDNGVCVRINSIHRFAKLIYENNSINTDLQIIFEILLLQLAEGEIYSYKNILDIDREKIEKIISEYRRVSSEYLASLCRSKSESLPPYKN